ncbi:hypothetical protein ACQR1W_00305 [Bradyrhizobium sp. HKCCYLS1011]|uniref:hypothetical protein n=1 Tax=Bradyrhizobium sp. HKCCYLS1011 TaxID=3420733 RepID=UPI003EBFA9E5
MRLQRKLMIVAGATAALAAAAIGELVFDLRMPRASLVEIHAITTSVSILIADYDRAVEAMKAKYGADAQTVLETQPPRLITRVGDKIVEEKRAPGQFSDARGLFVIGRQGRLESTFPFQIDPHESPAFGRQGEPSVRYLRDRFGKKLSAQYFEFDDRDAVTDTCITMSPAELGWIGRQLSFQSGTFCVVFWKGTSPGSMLIGVALADGDPWMRPFTRRICRWITTIALQRVAATDREPAPDYAACLLVDRPNRSGADGTLRAHVYEVRRDATLAYVN